MRFPHFGADLLLLFVFAHFCGQKQQSSHKIKHVGIIVKTMTKLQITIIAAKMPKVLTGIIGEKPRQRNARAVVKDVLNIVSMV